MIEGGHRTKESFQRLAAAELPGLYSLARRLVRDGAEDLVQEALLRAYRSFGTLKADPAAGRWLKSILVNVFRDELRRATWPPASSSRPASQGRAHCRCEDESRWARGPGHGRRPTSTRSQMARCDRALMTHPGAHRATGSRPPATRWGLAAEPPRPQ
jgi:DNA-directed RNA polymerase specialized sigma24 family protein